MHQFWKLLPGAAAVPIAAALLSLAPVAASAETEAAASTPAIATATTQAETDTTPGWHRLDNNAICYYSESGTCLTGIQTIDGKRYLFSDAGILKTGWQMLDGLTYYYDPETGEPQYGWLELQGKRYYVDSIAGRRTGWVTLSESGETKRYYFDGDGILQTGFFRTTENGDLYCAQSDGSLYANGVYTLADGNPYWFLADGTLKTGWQTVDGARRYYDPVSGQAVTGWVEWNSCRYYISQDTGKLEGIQLVDGTYYPFSETTGAVTAGLYALPDGTSRYYYADGSVATGFLKLDGATYYFEENGNLYTGWLELNASVYYFEADGKMATGFTEIDGHTCYFNNDGTQCFGLKTIGGKLYDFHADTGYLLTGWVTAEEHTYYFQADGTAAKGWLDIQGKRYYFSSEGYLCTGWMTIGGNRYCFRTDGTMVTGWQKDADGYLYYFSETGAALTGWQTIGNSTYYFQENGAAACGILEISGTKYHFDDSTGALLRSQTTDGITTDQNGVVTKVTLTTELLKQDGFPTGCESVSAVILLRDAGYSTSVATFVDSALDKESMTTKNGVLYGPDPNVSFAGDPRSSSSFGCFAPVITKALNKILTGGDQAKTIQGASISQLLTDYVDKGIPVAIWATMYMKETSPGRQWIISSTGKTYTWKKQEHCLVLVGYDSQYYYLNDPLQAGSVKAYERSLVENRYASMGSQAVVIVKG